MRLGDPKMAALIEEHGPLPHHLHSDYFYSLTSAIISQQISTAAARNIFGKLQKALDHEIKAEAIAAMSDQEFKACGISPQKMKYLRDLAEHFNADPRKFSALHEFNDDEVIELLLPIKGIGKWTVHMFLMFTLDRPDIFPADDLGIKKAMMKLYGWKTSPDKAKMEKKAMKWSPHRTLACRYLWKSLSMNGGN